MARKNIAALSNMNNKKANSTKKEVKNKKIITKKDKKQEILESEQINDEQQIDDEQVQQSVDEEDNKQKEEGSDGQSQNEGSDQEQDDEQQSSQSSLAPENYAIKQMQFRERRGTKMNYLMSRKKDEEEDQFWKNQGQDYFGNLEDQQNDQDYQQSSSGRDEFDSDFDQTQSQHNEPEGNKVEEPQVDQDKEKEKKRQQELMRKIGAPAPKKIAVVKTNTSNKKKDSEKKPVPQVVNRYIHQVCTQELLLGEAAQTQYINWLSLQKLISLQNEKKDFTHREHFLEGQKIIYRDKIDKDGNRGTSYELVGVNINKIADLTQMMNKQKND